MDRKTRKIEKNVEYSYESFDSLDKVLHYIISWLVRHGDTNPRPRAENLLKKWRPLASGLYDGQPGSANEVGEAVIMMEMWSLRN